MLIQGTTMNNNTCITQKNIFETRLQFVLFIYYLFVLFIYASWLIS